VPVPVADTVKVTDVPWQEDWLIGWVRMEVAVFTDKVAPLESTVPHWPVTETVYIPAVVELILVKVMDEFVPAIVDPPFSHW
jgi:hypothetical protein